MVDAFIGSRVSLLLEEDASLSGVFAEFDPVEKKLTLEDVALSQSGTRAHLARFSIAATRILDLKIVHDGCSRTGRASGCAASQLAPGSRAPKPSPAPRTADDSALPRDPAILSFRPPPASVCSTQPSTDVDNTCNYRAYPKHAGDSATTAYVENSASAHARPEHCRTASQSSTGYERSPNRKSNKQYGGKAKQSPGRRGRLDRHHEWADDDVRHFIEEEFDFQRNLGLFDKARVFAEIKEKDQTAPESRLVHHNRLPQNRDRQPATRVDTLADELAFAQLDTTSDDGAASAAVTPRGRRQVRHVMHQRNLAPTENVLEDSRGPYVDHGAYSVSGSEGSDDEESDTTVNGRRAPRSPGGGRRVRLRTFAGVQCPVVTAVQMLEAERVAITDTGPNEDQMMENAGRGVCQLMLKVLGGNIRINVKNRNAAPVIAVLCGNNKVGSYAMAAARHLANHGCQVLACVVGSTPVKTLAEQRRIFLPTGGLMYNSADELPGPQDSLVDMIVDGLLGSQYALKDVADPEDRAAIKRLIMWANANKAPVISLDLPSGAKRTSGSSVPRANPAAAPCIEPKITVCLGAPKAGLTDRNATGEVYLADVGIPCCVWKQVGVRNWSPAVFGSEYVVGLEYYSP